MRGRETILASRRRIRCRGCGNGNSGRPSHGSTTSTATATWFAPAKRGIGAGKINGPGGKIDPGETPLQSAIRESQEELHITPLDPVKMGELWFAMTHIPDIHCHVFMARKWEGEPTETEEAVPLWTPIAENSVR
jgi:8-oxo-dGTP pyrophosphatase MutT (NUDIX family)